MSFLSVRGVRLPDRKKETRNVPVIEIRPQEEYIVPLILGQHAECVPIVSVGDYVCEGTAIAKPGDRFSPFVFSPVCGVVTDIITKNTGLGMPCKHIVIRANKDTKKVLLPPVSDMSGAGIYRKMVESGMMDNFGKRLPAFVKYQNANNKKIDKLVINCTEMDTYLTSSEILLKEYTNDCLEGAKLLASVLQTKLIEFYVTTKQNELYELLKKEFKARNKVVAPEKYTFKLVKIDAIYPFEHERLITYYITGKKLLAGSPSSDAGIVVDSVQNCYDVSKAVYENKPVTTRLITVAGNNIIRKANYLVKSGTKLKDILDVVGTINPGEKFKIIEGGVMTGIAQDDIDISVSLSTKAILFLSRDEFLRETEKVCVNCGACMSHCPVKINPKEIDKACIEGDKIKALHCGIMACIDCGNCSYVCPSKRYIAQRIWDMQDEIRRGGRI